MTAIRRGWAEAVLNAAFNPAASKGSGVKGSSARYCAGSQLNRNPRLKRGITNLRICRTA